jgi:hypothetical protein
MAADAFLEFRELDTYAMTGEGLQLDWPLAAPASAGFRARGIDRSEGDLMRRTATHQGRPLSLDRRPWVLFRQRPGPAEGGMFVTIEEEGDNANLIIRSSLFEQSRRVAVGARMLDIYGQVQREGRHPRHCQAADRSVTHAVEAR